MADAASQQDAPDPSATAHEVRQMVRAARRATLASIDHRSGGPFASLIITATAMDGAPVTCLSTLAWHSANLAAEPRASLLFESATGGDVLAQARVTLTGRMVRTEDAEARRRFLAAHPSAAGYAAFRDFHMYAFQAEQAHLVAGFGRIQTIGADALALDTGHCAALVDIEDSALAHMAQDHADAARLYATVLLGLADGDWRMTGIDPEGADLMAGDMRARLRFAEPVTGPGPLRKTLAALAAEARVRQKSG